MGDQQSDTKFQEQALTQNLNEKSSVLKSVFAFHNRHISSGTIKEVINSKPDLKSFETFKEIVEEQSINSTRMVGWIHLNTVREVETDHMNKEHWSTWLLQSHAPHWIHWVELNGVLGVETDQMIEED